MMDEEMEDFIEEECCSSSETSSSSSEVDSDYEFDAARFFDFTRPETCSEADEAEGWFRFAPSYPPSPFVVKLNLAKILSAEEACCSSKLEETKSMNSTITNSEGTSPERHMNQDIQKARTKSMAKPAKARSSTLMKPTASLLAKQNKLQDVYSSHLCQRLKKPSIEKSLQSPSGSEDLATKRQKLESGFVRKVAHLKHQIMLLHKISKKGGSLGGNSSNSRLKVTIPKEPQLETTQRAERHRSRNNSESSEHAKPKGHTFKARPLNRKVESGASSAHGAFDVLNSYHAEGILEGPATLPPKKSALKLPDFQVFNLKTKERAMQHSSSNVLDKHSDDSVIRSRVTNLRSSNSEDVSKKEKCETSPKCNGRPLNRKLLQNFTSKERMGVNQNIRQEATISQESRTLSGERLPNNPPIELFNKLSIKSAETNTVSQTKVRQYAKGSKENAPDSIQLELWRCMGKPNQCGGSNGIPEIGCHPNMSRSLDIR